MSLAEELDVTTQIDSHFVLTGHTWDNVVDTTQANTGIRIPTMRRYLLDALRSCGMQFVVIADPVHGFTLERFAAPDGSQVAAERLHKRIANIPDNDDTTLAFPPKTPTINDLGEVVRALVESEALGGIIISDAALWTLNRRQLSPEEHDFFALAASLARRTDRRMTEVDGVPRRAFPAVLWLCRSDTDLPSWYVADPGVRMIAVEGPDADTRRAFGAQYFAEDRQDEFARDTHGFSVRQMLNVVSLTGQGHDLSDAAKVVRLGVTRNPWTEPDLLDRLRTGRERLGQRVIGQDAALDAAWASMCTTLEGLSGAERPSAGRRPRIVVLAAGPTGTGKTEFAKAIADLVFMDANAMHRFDMSTFKGEHSLSRLIGAPPGYVGHDAGGELTNAVRARPFSVVLFDEFEKAEPRVLDALFSVLDEGHLDDSLGRRVYFDQTVLVFTTNIGVPRTAAGELIINADTPYDRLMPYDELRGDVSSAIRRWFDEIDRPELLNRFGNGLLVFNYLGYEASRKILEQMVANVQRADLERNDVTVTYDDGVIDRLAELCICDPSMGGRGIANKLATHLTDPLSVAQNEWRRNHRDVRAVRVQCDPSGTLQFEVS